MAKVQLKNHLARHREEGAIERYYGVAFEVRSDFTLVAEVEEELAKEMLANGRCCKAQKVAE